MCEEHASAILTNLPTLFIRDHFKIDLANFKNARIWKSLLPQPCTYF